MSGKAGLSVSGSSDGGEDGGNPEDTINSTIIQEIIAQIQRSYKRNRKVRIKLLTQINVYFFKIAEFLEKDVSVQSLVMEHIEGIQTVILESTKLCICLSEPSTKIQEVYGTIYDLGSYLETFIIGVYTWCLSNGKLLGKVMRKFLNTLIEVSCENPDTWLYYVMISPFVLHILNTMFEDDHADVRSQWALNATELMKQMTKAVFSCGDFGCQYYLLTVLHGWTQWIHSGKALPIINSIFSCVDPSARKELFMSEEPSERIRSFLNSLNLSPRGPRSVIPILANYVFVGECKLNSEVEFWVDFSVGSGRLHAFYSMPGAPFLELSFRKDQIHSICLNWVVHDGDDTSQAVESQFESQPTPSTFSKDEKVLFFHIVLSTDFEDISRDIESLIGKKCRSVYFVFRNGDLVEKILKQMNYSEHACGSMQCQRPRLLRRMLASENKLSYTQSWCPVSQVFGLDKSPLDGSTRSFLNQTDQDLDSTFSRVQRFHSPHRSITISPGAKLCLDISSAEDSQTQSENMPEVELVSLDTSKNPLAANLVETPGAFYVSMASGEDLITSEEAEISRDDRLDITGTTNETFYEDPLPRNDRRKFAHLGKHVPFQLHLSPQNKPDRILSPKESTNPLKRQNQRSIAVDVQDKENLPQRQSKVPRIRSSSPKPNVAFQNRCPPTPCVSEICSPPNNVFNATIMDFEPDSSFEELDQVNEPGGIQTDTSLMRSLEENDLSLDATKSPASSPVVSYSKLRQAKLGERLKTIEEETSTHSQCSGKSTAKKSNCSSDIQDRGNEPSVIYETSISSDISSAENTSCNATIMDSEHGSSYEELDQVNEPDEIQTNTSLMRSLEENDLSLDATKSPALSPVVGYSKLRQAKLGERLKTIEEETSTHSQCSGNPTAKKSNCSSDIQDREMEPSVIYETSISSDISSAENTPFNATIMDFEPDSSYKELDQVNELDEIQTDTSLMRSLEENDLSIDATKSPALSPVVGYSKLRQAKLGERLKTIVEETSTHSQCSGNPTAKKSNCSSDIQDREKEPSVIDETSISSDISSAENTSFNATIMDFEPDSSYEESDQVNDPCGIGIQADTSLMRSLETKSSVPQNKKTFPCYANAYQLRLASQMTKKRNPAYDPYDLLTCSDDSIWK